jgi:hypothetical protein
MKLSQEGAYILDSNLNFIFFVEILMNILLIIF